MIRVIVEVAKGARVKVCGNHPLLGNWNPAEAAPMSCGKSLPLWVLSLPEELPAEVEFKFIIVCGDEVTWEEGENRTIGSPGNLAFRGQAPWHTTGVAVPIFSLRSTDDFGCGDFADLPLLCDYAKAHGMRIIQLLPINDTTNSRTEADSYPYSANSSFALHPLYMRLQDLDGVPDDAASYEALRQELQALPSVDYARVIAAKEAYIRAVYNKVGDATLQSREFARFIGENYSWLLPYAAYSVLRDRHSTADCSRWGRHRHYSAAIVTELLLSDTDRPAMGYYLYMQYHLHRQLAKAVQYCRENGVALKGDIPIGVSATSCDAWQHPELFNLGMQAGAPPDAFAKQGQNWGFPTYNWEQMSLDGYAWWSNRLKHMAQYFDAYRIDHVLGFFRIWEIPVSAVYGLLGHFSPALPLSPEAMRQEFGFEFLAEMARPGSDVEGYASQREALAAGREDLLPRFADVLFVEDPRQPGHYHPRIEGYDTNQFRRLSSGQQEAYRRLHEDFFYRRHNDMWAANALRRLPAVVDATAMLPCAEDLGMIPACVPSVLSRLQVLTLEVQRMPKEYGVRLGNPQNYPYMSVATTSTHDMPPLRLWWLLEQGCDPSTEECAAMVREHVESPSMLVVLPLQDWLASSATLRSPNPRSEQINDPANPNHVWRYRLHLNLEQLSC